MLNTSKKLTVQADPSAQQSKYLPKILRILGKLVAIALIGLIGLYLIVLVSFRLSGSKYARELSSRAEVIETEKGPIEVLIRGDLSDPAVLVSHGTAGGYDGGELMFKYLFDDEFSYIIPSRPGYLRTPLSTGRTPAEQADAYAALLDELGVDQVSLIGGSGGAPSTLEFARRYPERTSSLVLISAVSRTLPNAVEPIPSKDLITRIFGQGFLEWAFTRPAVYTPERVTSFFEQDFADSWSRVLVDEEKMQVFTGMVMTSLSNYPEGIRWDGYENDSNTFMELDLGSFEAFSVPTLIIHGTDDKNVPFESSQALSEEISGAETLWLESGDHMLIFARWEDFRPTMDKFLRQHAQVMVENN